MNILKYIFCCFYPSFYPSASYEYHKEDDEDDENDENYYYSSLEGQDSGNVTNYRDYIVDKMKKD